MMESKSPYTPPSSDLGNVGDSKHRWGGMVLFLLPSFLFMLGATIDGLKKSDNRAIFAAAIIIFFVSLAVNRLVVRRVPSISMSKVLLLAIGLGILWALISGVIARAFIDGNWWLFNPASHGYKPNRKYFYLVGVQMLKSGLAMTIIFVPITLGYAIFLKRRLRSAAA
jgi:hypothetical protein